MTPSLPSPESNKMSMFSLPTMTPPDRPYPPLLKSQLHALGRWHIPVHLDVFFKWKDNEFRSLLVPHLPISKSSLTMNINKFWHVAATWIENWKNVKVQCCEQRHGTYGSVSCNAHGQDLPWTRPGSTRRNRPCCRSWSLPQSWRAEARHWAHSSCFRAKQRQKNDKHILSRWDAGITAEAPIMCWRRPAHCQREGRRYKYVRRIFMFQFSCIWCVPEYDYHGWYPDLIPKDNEAFSY